MRKSTIYLFVLGVALVGSMTCAGLVVSAQNTNSSTTMAPSNGNTNKPRRTGRRRTRKPANANTATQSSDAATANTNSTPRTRRGRRRGTAKTGDTASMATPKKTGRCDPTQQEQTDLSGTYTGKAKHGTEPAVDATLTITGNNFTMTAGPETHSGRMTAVTTCGYTAVTVMMGDLTPPTPGPNPPAALPAMSMRAKKVGDKLWLMTVPGEKMQASFTPTGGSMKSKPRKHRSTTKKTETAPAKTTP